jgi:hypothetical protein
MLLETFKAVSDSGYVIIPVIVVHVGYISYDYSGMEPAEVSAWKDVITIPEVRRMRSFTADDYQKTLQSLGIRCALVGTVGCRVLRAKYHSQPLSRRIK